LHFGAERLGLKDKVGIVTGGSRGIGKACAKELLREGASVGLVSKYPDINSAARIRKIPRGRNGNWGKVVRKADLKPN
jgi:NAD(P)-dependent dehydrogenase (short-subunit alcohol dehydrogenase family)